MAYSLILEFDATHDDGMVKVRVCIMWENINPKRCQEIISVD